MKIKFTLFFTITCIVFSYAQVNLNEGLIANYTFKEVDHIDNKIPDITNRGNDMNTFDLDYFDDDRSNVEGEAAMFSGENGIYAMINPENNLADFTALDQFSFSFFNLLLSNIYDLYGEYPVFSIEDATGNQLTLIYHKEEDFEQYVLRLSSNGIVLFEKGVDYTFFHVNNWANIIFSYDAVNNNLKYYVDGELAASTDLALPVFDNPHILFGKSSSAAAKATCFDDLYIFDRIINEEEVVVLSESTTTEVLDLNANKNISIYPIPSTDKMVNIDIDGYSESFDVVIYDQLGRVVQKTTVISGAQLDLNALNSGTHILNIYLGDKIYTKKVVLMD